MLDRELRHIVERSPYLVLVVSTDNRVEFANNYAVDVLGIDLCSNKEKPFDAMFRDPDIGHQIIMGIRPAWTGRVTDFAIDFNPLQNANKIELRAEPFYSDDSDEIVSLIITGRQLELTEDLGRKLNTFEYQDPTTGLLNRRSLTIIAEREILRAQRFAPSGSPKPMAALFVMLHDFKQINQIHGHKVGDLLLENTGLRVRETVRKSDYVFRWEGTNLVVLLPELASSLDAAVVAEKIVGAITVPYRYRNTELAPSCHIGVSVFPEDAQTADELLNRANSAVIEAERHHLDYLLFDEKLHERATNRIALKSSLQMAFHRNEFELYYQPIVHPDGRIAGAEALMRWNHPERGLIGPGDFIGLAEGSRLIEAIDKVALYNAIQQLVDWTDYDEIFITLNVSAADLKDSYLPSVVQQAMIDLGLPDDHRRRLKLELTESRSLERRGVSEASMRELSEIDVAVWIDDFGTGQSSLSYLKHLPITTVKIDKDFVIDLGTNANDQLYLSGIVSTVRSRDKDVVVEGVSNAAQAKLVEGMEIKYLQGFYFGRPIPAVEFTQLLAAGESLPPKTKS